MIGTRFTPQLVEEYNKKYWDSKLVADYVDQNAKKYPDKEAVVDSEKRLTWLQVSQQSDQLALALIDMGFKKDDILMVQLSNCVELYVLLIAGEKAGVPVVSCQNTFREYEISAIGQFVKAKGIVIPLVYRDFNYYDMLMGFRDKLTTLQHVIITGTDDVPSGTISLNSLLTRKLKNKELTRDYLQKTRAKPYEITRIVTTSGTTGIPKCCEWPSAPLLYAGKLIINRWQLSDKDVVGAFYNIIGGGLSIVSVYSVAVCGAKLALLERFTPEGFCELVQKEKITVAAIVPAEVARLLEYPDIDKYDLSSLRLMAHSTTLLPRELALRAESKLGMKYVQTYGTMDSAPISCNSVYDPVDVRIGTVGKPYDGTVVKIVDSDGKPVPSGEYGEILAGGPTSGSGYFNNPEKTAQCWQGGLFDTTNEGTFTPEGNIVIMGRRRDIIKRGGQLIYPKDIEDILTEYPKISQVSVVRMPDRIMGEKACAFIVPRSGQKLTSREVIDFIKAKKVAPFKLPERVEFRDELPMVPAGNKVDVIRLEKEIADILEKESQTKK